MNCRELGAVKFSLFLDLESDALVDTSMSTDGMGSSVGSKRVRRQRYDVGETVLLPVVPEGGVRVLFYAIATVKELWISEAGIRYSLVWHDQTGVKKHQCLSDDDNLLPMPHKPPLPKVTTSEKWKVKDGRFWKANGGGMLAPFCGGDGSGAAGGNSVGNLYLQLYDVGETVLRPDMSEKGDKVLFYAIATIKEVRMSREEGIRYNVVRRDKSGMHEVDEDELSPMPECNFGASGV